jgi:ankyrin repeat protein
VLLSQGVRADFADADGRTPISYAAEWGHLDIVKEFLTREDVNPDYQDDYRRCPLAYALREHHWDVAKVLKPHCKHPHLHLTQQTEWAVVKYMPVYQSHAA